jgi:integrase
MIISAILWHKSNKDGLYPIKIKLYENRKNKYIITGLSVQKIQWSTTNNRVLNNHPKADYFNSIIKNLLDSYNGAQTEKEEIIGEQESGTLGDLFGERIRDFNSKNRISAVKRYTTILRHLKELKLNTLPLNTINKEHIRLFNMYLINKRKLSNSALRNYNKVVKTALNYAEDNPRFVLPRTNPYHKFDPIRENGGTRVTLKLQNIHTLDEAIHFEIPLFSNEFIATSHFLLAFYLMGIRFNDLIKLKWSNLRFNEVVYTMTKTGQVMNCFLNDKILNIIKYYLPETIYPKNPEQYMACKNKEGQEIFKLEVKYREYRNLIIHSELSQTQREDFEKVILGRDKLLRIIINKYSRNRNEDILGDNFNGINDAQKTYEKISSLNAKTNKSLKNIAYQYEIEPFSYYSARHTFAHNFRKTTNDLYKVSKALGHSSTTITENYLKAFESLELYEDTDKFYKDMNTLYKV